MDSKDAQKIDKIIEDRKAAHRKLSAQSNVYRSFLAMEQQAFEDGQLEKYIKELIAIGISIVIHCESCLEWHIQQALLSGASEAQVVEAIGVGIEMGGGPATVSARFALKALDYHTERMEQP